MSKNKVIFNRYVHFNDEENNDIVEFFGDEDLQGCAYEVELVYEYDTKTKDLRLIGVDGLLLSEKAINSKKLTKIPQS